MTAYRTKNPAECPREMEDERFELRQKGWGNRLLYDVFLKDEKGIPEIFLGTCIIERWWTHLLEVKVLTENKEKKGLLTKRKYDVEKVIKRNL